MTWACTVQTHMGRHTTLRNKPILYSFWVWGQMLWWVVQFFRGFLRRYTTVSRCIVSGKNLHCMYLSHDMSMHCPNPYGSPKHPIKQTYSVPFLSLRANVVRSCIVHERILEKCTPVSRCIFSGENIHCISRPWHEHALSKLIWVPTTPCETNIFCTMLSWRQN